MFQSLGRDSVGWDNKFFDSFKISVEVSIPRSGFCGVGLQMKSSFTANAVSFNPSVGILWGGT